MNLILALTNLARRVNEQISHLNCGGCGFFASLVARELENIPGVEGVTIRIGSHGGDDADTLRQDFDSIRPLLRSNTVTEWNKWGIHIGHAIVQFNWEGRTYHYDSNFLLSASEHTRTGGYPLYASGMTHKEMWEMCQSEGWNPFFDRGQVGDVSTLVYDNLGRYAQ